MLDLCRNVSQLMSSILTQHVFLYRTYQKTLTLGDCRPFLYLSLEQFLLSLSIQEATFLSCIHDTK